MIKRCCIATVILLSAYILSPFLAAVGMGAIFAVLFFPWMKRIDKGHFPNFIAAGFFTAAVTLLLFLPVSALMVVGVKSGLTELKRFKQQNPGASGPASQDEVLDQMFASAGIDRMLVRAARVAPLDPTQVSDQLKELIANIAIGVGDRLSTFISQIPSMSVG